MSIEDGKIEWGTVIKVLIMSSPAIAFIGYIYYLFVWIPLSSPLNYIVTGFIVIGGGLGSILFPGGGPLPSDKVSSAPRKPASMPTRMVFYQTPTGEMKQVIITEDEWSTTVRTGKGYEHAIIIHKSFGGN